MARKSKTDAALLRLRALGLSYPGAHTKSPWPGHFDLAVDDKTFAYLSLEGEPLAISCKLPRSAPAALMLVFTKPTAYGLGKSGWVSASFPDGDVPEPMLRGATGRRSASRRVAAGSVKNRSVATATATRRPNA